jgi:hypothetical protein
LCEVTDQCDNPLEYINYNTPRRAHQHSYLHPSYLSHHKQGGRNRSTDNNKRLAGSQNKPRKSLRVSSTPENTEGDGQLISSDTEQEKGKKMASLGMGMVSNNVFI